MIENKIIYPALSYKIVGVLFSVYNELGPGYHEKYYQKAIAKNFNAGGIQYQEQVKIPIEYKQEDLGIYYLDFLIEQKIILEIKQGDYYPRYFYEQVNNYLKTTGLRLAILANFSTNGVRFRRVLNIR